jgi:hypothetical protein
MVLTRWICWILILPLCAAAAEAPALKVKRPAKRVFSRNHLTSAVSYVWWQEPVELTDPAGKHYGMLANTNGPCFGFGWLRTRSNFDFSLDGCFVLGFTDVSYTQPPPPQYFQQSVSTYGALMTVGLLYKPSSKFVTMGLDIPVMARYTDWTIPKSGYNVTPVMRYTAGLNLDFSWRVRRFVLSQKIGPMYGMSWLWRVQLQYIY